MPLTDLFGFATVGLLGYAAAEYDGFMGHSDERSGCPDKFSGSVLGLGLLIASPWLMCSIVGFVMTEQCAARKEEWRRFDEVEAIRP